MSDAWKPSRIALKVRGTDGNPADLLTDGFVNGLFGLDQRPNEGFGTGARRGKIWCMTHLPTGYAIRFIYGAFDKAVKIADEIAAAADWEFTDPAEAKSRGPAIKKLMDKHPTAFAHSYDAGPPAKALGRTPDEIGDGCE